MNAAILTPADSSHPPAGRTHISGYAYAGGDRTVARVDVSADDGATWTQAELTHSDDRWTWTTWTLDLDLDLEPGRHVLAVRAWDNTGAQQPQSPEAVWNPKGYANTSWDRLQLDVV